MDGSERVEKRAEEWIDLSRVSSKYVGETEKNLARLFDRAEEKGWIVFFDESDVLFGKRTEVGDAHDKYAEQETSSLLKRVESVAVVMVLGDEHSDLDDDFLRRLRASVRVAPPETAGAAEPAEPAEPAGAPRTGEPPEAADARPDHPDGSADDPDADAAADAAAAAEAGWLAFLNADGVEDWAVLHGGPTAVFRAGSLAESARLAAAVSELPGLGARALLTAASDRLTVKLTREMWGTREEHIGLARAISAIAREHGARADKSAVQEVQVAVAAKPDAIDLPFWRAVLGYAPLHDDNCLDPLGQGSTVWMQELDPNRPLRHAMHIDVSVARSQIEGRLAAALAAGGVVVDQSEAPASWILADRSGNKVCIAAWPDGARPAGA